MDVFNVRIVESFGEFRAICRNLELETCWINSYIKFLELGNLKFLDHPRSEFSEFLISTALNFSSFDCSYF